MRRHVVFCYIGLSLFFSAAFAHGQGFLGQNLMGPGSGSTSKPGPAVMSDKPITVSEAKSLPNDSWVVLTGNVINQLPGGRQYTFRDSTGEIAVDIGAKEWRSLSVGADDRVEIHGEVKVHRGQISIKVHAIKKI